MLYDSGLCTGGISSDSAKENIFHTAVVEQKLVPVEALTVTLPRLLDY